jgi:DNA-binding response OmpR family regulator
MKEGANDSAPGRSTEDSTCDPDFSSAVRILLIDDDRELCTSLQRLLQMNGFDLSFAHNAQDGLTHAVEGQHDLIVLDVMLPGGDGRLLLRKLRTVSEVPVIMLTARGDEKDRIAGLEAGADDYLPKPFNVRELIARIRAILKRHGPRVTLPQPIQLGDLEIFPTQRRVVQSSSEIAITGTEFEILLLLVKSFGKVVTRDEIAEVCLGRPVGMFDRSVDNHISNLRKKLGATFQGKDRIQNLRGTGYVYTGGPAS